MTSAFKSNMGDAEVREMVHIWAQTGLNSEF